MTNTKKEISDVPPMDDEHLGGFWEVNEPEEFEGWEQGTLEFKRVPKKLIQLRLEPKDIRIIDRESKLSGIDRSQLIRSWVKEKIRNIENRKENIRQD